MSSPAPRRRPLKIGVQLPEAERLVPWAELAEMARTIEDVGFDSLWVGDHLLYRDRGPEPVGPWEAWSLLAALATTTRRVEIGPLVACLGFHNPAMLAKKAATIEEISGGRLILGVGAGWNNDEFAAYGFPFDHRVDRFAEAFTIVRTLLRDGAVDFAGHYHQARDCVLTPRGPRPDGPPLMVGSLGPRVLGLTLPHVDSWNAWYADFGNDPAALPPLLARLDAACRAAGRDPATLERTVALLIGLSGARGRVSSYGTSAPLEGPPETIAAAIRAVARAGIAHVQLVLDPITVGSIEALAPVLALLDDDDPLPQLS